MENQIDTVTDLRGAIIAEMERLNCSRPYCIVWDKLCGHAGVMPVGAVSVEHGRGS